MSGAVSFHAGMAAEHSVAAHYERLGYRVVERRWRCAAGEVDLIARRDDGLVFVEVKKSRDFAAAAQNLSRRQMERIMAAATVYVGTTPAGQMSEMRFDVALVDSVGRIEVIENAYGGW